MGVSQPLKDLNIILFEKKVKALYIADTSREGLAV